MARGIHKLASMDTRWKRLTWDSHMPRMDFDYSSVGDLVSVLAFGVVVVGGRASATTVTMTLPRGGYRFFIVGGGGGGADKRTNGTITVDSNDYATVTGGKYSLAGGGSGGVAVVDLHVPYNMLATVVAGRAGARAGNTTTKATNGGASSITIGGMGITLTCSGGNGGTAKDGASGTAGTGGAFVSSGTSFSVVYSNKGITGTRKYVTSWTTKESGEKNWPEAYGGMWNSSRSLGYCRANMASVLAIPQTYASSLYGTHKKTFVCRDTNANTSYTIIDNTEDATSPDGNGELIPVGCGGCTSLWIPTGKTLVYDGHSTAGVGMVAIERK